MAKAKKQARSIQDDLTAETQSVRERSCISDLAKGSLGREEVSSNHRRPHPPPIAREHKKSYEREIFGKTRPKISQTASETR